MKKSDLKTGMVIETADNRRGIVMLDTSEGNKIVGSSQFDAKQTWSPLGSWTEDLKYIGDGDRDIQKIYEFGPSNCFGASTTTVGKLLWERKLDIRDNMIAGNWYLNLLGGVFCFTGKFDQEGDPLGYGWTYDENVSEPYEWTDLREGELDGWSVVGSASQSKVLELFRQEAIKRQLIAGTYIKGGFCGNASKTQIIQNQNHDIYDFSNNDYRLIGASEAGHALTIFNKGEWIEVLSIQQKFEEGSIIRIIDGGYGARGVSGKLGMVVLDESITNAGNYKVGGIKVQVGTTIWGLLNDCIIKEIQ